MLRNVARRLTSPISSFARSVARHRAQTQSTYRYWQPVSQRVRFSTTSSIPSGKSPVGGFSFPAPRKLGEIVKLDRLENEDAESITHIWNEYHKSQPCAASAVMSASDFALAKSRATQNRFFTFPVFRDPGFFVLLSQFQENHWILTYLADFQKNPAEAQPYLTITVYEDLAKSKGLVLLRADVCNLLTVTRDDAIALLELVCKFHVSESLFQHVLTFNKAPRTFDYNHAFDAAKEVLSSRPSSTPVKQ